RRSRRRSRKCSPTRAPPRPPISAARPAPSSSAAPSPRRSAEEGAMAERYFDDFAIGEKFVTRGVALTESMIMDFALTYDPQPFHIDVEAARASNYGGLIASGFHTLVLGFR